jgi:acetolactate synthase small subunit
MAAAPTGRDQEDPVQMITLELDVDDGPDVLVRVLTTLRRRRCEITRVGYVARDRHHPGRMVIGIEAPRAHAHCVEAWLANLVDVVSVSLVGGADEQAPLSAPSRCAHRGLDSRARRW